MVERAVKATPHVSKNKCVDAAISSMYEDELISDDEILEIKTMLFANEQR